MNNLVVRSLTGIVFVSAIISVILWNQWAASIIFGSFMLLGIHEFTGLVNKNTNYAIPQILTFSFAGLTFAGFVTNFAGLLDAQVLTFSVILLIVIALVASIYTESTNAIQRTALTFFSWLYILIPFILITQMCFAEGNKWEIVGMFAIIWANDSMAYATGRLFGKTKLFERISPKKTWEGTIGGIIFALGIGFVWSTYVSELPLTFWIICSSRYCEYIFIVAITQLGGNERTAFFSTFNYNHHIAHSGNDPVALWEVLPVRIIITPELSK